MKFITCMPNWLLGSLFILSCATHPVGAPLVGQDPEVIIVGAGLAGLSTAYRLKKEGKTFLMLEMSPHIGGRVRTANYNENISAEVGLEEFWEGNPTLDIFKELKVPLEKSATCFSSYISNKKIMAFTQDTNAEFLKSFLTNEELKTYKEWDQKTSELYHKIQKGELGSDLMALKDISFGDWVIKKGKLSKKVQELIRIETEPEYGVPWQRISALDGIAEWHLFSGEGTPSFHVVGGNHQGALAIAESIGKDHILLNRQVTNIKSNNDGVEVTAVDADFKQHIYHAKYAVTTAPLFRLNEIQFEPPLSSDRVQAIQTQTWGAYFTAHLILDAKASQFWTVKGESILPILSDSVLGVIYGGNSNKPESVQNSNETILNLLITGDPAEGFNARTGALDDVRAILLKNFEKLWPGIGKFVKKLVFYRYHPRAIASWPVGRSRFDLLSQSLRKPQGRVYFAGDFTEGTHSDGAAISAIRVVSDILSKEKAK